MSFIKDNANATVYAPGWFLAAEKCNRETRDIPANHSKAVTAEGGKYVPMGTVYPSNDANAIGFLYEDVDVTTGNMPGSVVTSGVVYTDRLPETLASAARTALAAAGFVFKTAPTVTRPY